MILQKKAVEIINFQTRNLHTSSIFKQGSILKFQDNLCLKNILFVSKFVNSLTRSVFNTWFNLSSDQHNYETSSFRQDNFIKSSYRTNGYGKYSIIASAADSWKKIQEQLKATLLKDISPNIIKTVVSNFHLESY